VPRFHFTPRHRGLGGWATASSALAQLEAGSEVMQIAAMHPERTCARGPVLTVARTSGSRTRRCHVQMLRCDRDDVVRRSCPGPCSPQYGTRDHVLRLADIPWPVASTSRDNASSSRRTRDAPTRLAAVSAKCEASSAIRRVLPYSPTQPLSSVHPNPSRKRTLATSTPSSMETETPPSRRRQCSAARRQRTLAALTTRDILAAVGMARPHACDLGRLVRSQAEGGLCRRSN
jgi:hypothetical protein